MKQSNRKRTSWPSEEQVEHDGGNEVQPRSWVALARIQSWVVGSDSSPLFCACENMCGVLCSDICSSELSRKMSRWLRDWTTR